MDSFSFGMFMYELITLTQPFSDLNEPQIKQMVVEGKKPQLSSKVRDFFTPHVFKLLYALKTLL